MKALAGTLLALAVLAPRVAGAEGDAFQWQARFVGKADQYGFAFDDQGISWKTGRIARGCPEKERGLYFRVTEPMGLGFGQVFPDPNRKRAPVAVDLLIDPTRLKSPGSRAALELDSPFVPIGGSFDAFVLLVVERLGDGSLEVSTVAPMGVAIGMPLVLPEDTPGIVAALRYDTGLVDVAAGPCGGMMQPVLAGHALAYAGSSGLGVGIVGEKGDAAGFAFAISGDIHDAATQDVLGDLQALLDLELAAAADLMAGMTAEARTKAEQARALLEDQGPPVPMTDPQEYEPDLLEKVGALPESDAREAVLKRLRKAAERDAKARDKIDKGRPADLQEAAKQLAKARDEKLRAKAMLETGVAAEGKGKL